MQSQTQLTVPSVDLVTDAMKKSKNNNIRTFEGVKSSGIKDEIEKMKSQISQCLPKHITPERIIQLTTNYIATNPKIAECSVASIIGAMMQASILGLEPLPALGQVYFVPYSGRVQFQLGYKGIIKLAQNSGEIKTIYAEVVKKGDFFQYEKGLYPKLKHIPDLENEGDLTHVYAVAHYTNGGYNFEVLPKSKIESLRRRNHSQKNGINGAWATDYDSMAKAKAINQLRKFLPFSIEVHKAFISDGAIIDQKSFSNNNSGIDVDLIEFPDNESTSYDNSTGEINNDK